MKSGLDVSKGGSEVGPGRIPFRDFERSPPLNMGEWGFQCCGRYFHYLSARQTFFRRVFFQWDELFMLIFETR